MEETQDVGGVPPVVWRGEGVEGAVWTMLAVWSNGMQVAQMMSHFYLETHLQQHQQTHIKIDTYVVVIVLTS